MVTKFTGNGLWFISDTHWNHSMILQLCNRPFSSIEEHDQALIDNWNSVVKMEDTVFHLGDFCFGGAPKWKEIRDQLNGHIILILGNHDMRNITQGVMSMFDYVAQQMRIVVDGRTVYLNHFPFLTFVHWNPDVYHDNIAYDLFGHVHMRKDDTGFDSEFYKNYLCTQYEVGADLNNFTPISWEEIDKRIKYQIENNTNVAHWI